MRVILAVFYVFTGLFVITLADGTLAIHGRSGVSGFLGSALAFSIVGLLVSAAAVIWRAFHEDE